jgi:glycosyltransferase involved in cell wall biosynthesis
MEEQFPGNDINSVDYWNKRFFEDWMARGGRDQTAFFARLCCRELPCWFVDDVRSRQRSIFDYGCALGDALPVLHETFPASILRGGDVAQVGLGLARAFHPAFEFFDVNALGDGATVADVVYCSNTLEHFENWREMLDRLATHAGAYVLAVVPFEEEERIDEHVFTFEFDSLPARLSSGFRLLYIGTTDASIEPDTHWRGLQLLAIYGQEAATRSQRMPQSKAESSLGSLCFDLRGTKPAAIPPLLANLRTMSLERRRIARDAATLRQQLAESEARIAATEAANAATLQRLAEQAQAHAASHAVTIAELKSEAANRIGALEFASEGLNTILREQAKLTSGFEAAQRWLLQLLTELDPALVGDPAITAVPEAWPEGEADTAAAHHAALTRLVDAVNRANSMGVAFHKSAEAWQAEQAEMLRQKRHARLAMEALVGERDRARSRIQVLRDAAASPAARGSSADAAPLVSIILPVYNQAYLVDEAIAGVFAQTHRNWELIVLDDGSRDDLEGRVRQYLDERRVVFLRQPNQRLPAALNHAFAFARGELLTWTSADNIMLPTQLERLVEELALHPEAGLAYSDYWAIDDQGQPLDDADWRAHNRDPQIPDLIRLPDAVTIENFHRSGDNFIGASFMYRRAVAEIVGRYADDTFGGEDYDFWLRLHLATLFRHVAEPLYKYRVHADTLTARAQELGLFDNIRELLEADRWRIDTLLRDGTLHRGNELLRPVEQFHSAIRNRCRPILYTTLGEQGADATLDAPVVVDIDVPLRMIDAALLRRADLLLCRSDLTASLLRCEDWTRGKRIVRWDGEQIPAVQHAFVQAFADQVTAPVIAAAQRTAPRLDDPFRPERILLLVDRWAVGGLENVVVDLAESFAAEGRTVFVGSARDAPPPTAAFRDKRMRTLSFRADPEALDAFLRREKIELVNYHHSNFAAERVKGLGVATVYTMHNCYLWMDADARRRVADGLAAMDGLIAVSRQVAQFAAAQFAFPPERMVVIGNGLHADLITPPTRPALGPDVPFVVTMVASLMRPKLQHAAIAGFAAAAADIPEMRLQLIGAPADPAYCDELRTQIAAAPHGGRIELISGLTRAETIAALGAAHAFLLPSLVEGCSMALLEAAAMACVCVSSDVGAARELQALGAAVLLLPSVLGELDGVTQRQFLDAAAPDMPEHRDRIAAALRTVHREYGAYAGAALEAGPRLRDLTDMRRMTDAYLLAYTLARRGARPRPAVAAERLTPAPA